MGMLIEENEAEHIGMVIEEAAKQVDQRPDFTSKREWFSTNPGYGFGQRAVMRQEYLGRDLFLRGKITIEGSVGDPDSEREVADRGAIDTLFREEAQGFCLDPCPGRDAIARARWLLLRGHRQATVD